VKRIFVTVLVAAFVLALVPVSAAAQTYGMWDISELYPVDYPETHPLVPGEFDNQHYFLSEEAIEIMLGWASEYPDLVDVYTVGESYLGVPLYQMTITNKKTGPDTQKPAMWVGGNRHAGEVTAAVAALDFANELLTNYGIDPEITHLVDTRAFYIKPHENPDGSDLYLKTVQTLRSTVRPMDNDGNGVPDDDPADDINGDGFITAMRQYVGPGNGNYTTDPKDPLGRIMVNVGAGKGDYLYWSSEGIDRNGDGRINSDGIGGLDLHRNYPHNWRPMSENTGMGYTQSGAGEYPLSEPEIRSNFLFLVTHPNISIVQSMDTSVPMHLRGPSTSHPEESMFKVDNQYYDYFDEEGMKLSGYQRAGDVYHTYSSGRDNPLFGHGPDFGYFQYGSIWYGDELWGYRNFIEDYNEDGQLDQWDALWLNDNDPELTDRIFLPWTPGTHPVFGEVECGGFNPKFWSQNPPAGEWLKKAVEAQTRFNLLLAKSLPLLTVSTPKIQKTGQGTRITIQITNEGFLPDALHQAYLVKMVRPGDARLSIPSGSDVKLAEGSDPATQDIGFFKGALPDSDDTFKKLSGVDWVKTRTVSWLVTGSGPVNIRVRSTRGGWVNLTVNVE